MRWVSEIHLDQRTWPTPALESLDGNNEPDTTNTETLQQNFRSQHHPVILLDRSTKHVIITVGKAAGISLDRIHAGLALMEDKDPAKPQTLPLLVNQATAAKLLSVSRFTIRRLVAEGRLHPVKVREAVRYSRCEIEKLAATRQD